jgi:hypothetical protein
VPRDNRFPVPSSQEVAAAEKDLHEELKEYYTTKQNQLGGKLWNKAIGPGPQDRVGRYVALKEARDLAARNGDLRGALNADRILGDRYLVKRLESKCETIELAARSVHNPQQAQTATEYALQALDEAEAEPNYDLAGRLLKAAQAAAPKARKAALVETVGRRAAEVAAAKAELPRVTEALAVLAKTPDDPAANGAVGRFRCCVQDDWDLGLPHLAKGDDPAVKELAQKDLAEPTDPAERKALADGWFDQAGKEKDAAKKAFRRRAHSWYTEALPDLTGAPLKEARTRVAALVKAMPELDNPWRHLETAEASVRTDPGTKSEPFLHLDPHKWVPTRRSYKGAVEVTVVARTPRHNIRLTAGNGARVIFNWEGIRDGKQGAFIVSRPDNPGADGRGGFGGRDVCFDPDVHLMADRWHRLRWRLTPTGTKVWADGKLLYETEEAFDLTTPRPVAVCSFDDPIDVRSLVVKTLRGDALAKD